MTTDEAPQCRICYGSAEDELGQLFRPCMCDGTTAWVHVECLDRWRKSSANSQSFYRCEQCHFTYRFATAYDRIDRLTLARILTSRAAVYATSLALLALLVFAAGFVGKMLSPEQSWADVFRVFNLRHWIFGSYITGLGSLIGAGVSAMGFGTFRLGWDVFGDNGLRGLRGGRGGGGGGERGGVGELLVIIAVVIGLMVALYWVFNVVEDCARRTTRGATTYVLDATHIREARRRQQGRRSLEQSESEQAPHVD